MDNVLLGTEVDLYIDTMRCFQIEEIGSQSWLEWHTRLSKLQQQAVVEAADVREEYVKDRLVSTMKIPILVHEAILIQVWKRKILPLVLKIEPRPKNTFTVYSILYHEAICVSLLELVLFHANSCETLEDVAIDLLDYCHETATQLLGYKYRDEAEILENEPPHMEINRHKNDLLFDIGIRSISVLRYFCEYLENMPLSVTSRLFTTLDTPLLLVELLVAQPWLAKTDEGQLQAIYLNGKWKKAKEGLGAKLHPIEAQIWLGLRQLLLDPKCLTHYHFTEFRKEQLLKLQKYLHETVLDQISPLIDLKQWLCQLAMSNILSRENPPVLLEILPQIKTTIESQNASKWKQIAKVQTSILFGDHEHLVQIAQSLSDAYDTEIIENINHDFKTCLTCGDTAKHKCSRCKKAWYCTRDCQVKHWPKHREECDLIAAQN